MGVSILSNYNDITSRAYANLSRAKPDTKTQNTYSVLYYKERLFRRMMTIFRLDNLPDNWDREYIIRTILTRGYICVYETPQYGVIPLQCSLYGINPWGRPTNAIITNHILPNRDLIIGQECEVVRLQDDYKGATPILDIYAQKLANIDAGIDVNIFNCKVPWIFEVNGKEQEETAKLMYDKISLGEPAIFKRKETSLEKNDITMQQLNVTQTFIADKLQDEKNVENGEFLSEIGIDNSPVDKKERLVAAEVDSNNQALTNAVEDWNISLTEGFTRVNNHYNLNVKFSMPYYEHMKARVDSGTDTKLV